MQSFVQKRAREVIERGDSGATASGLIACLIDFAIVLPVILSLIVRKQHERGPRGIHRPKRAARRRADTGFTDAID